MASWPTAPRALRTPAHLILAAAGERGAHPHSTEEETEARSGQLSSHPSVVLALISGSRILLLPHCLSPPVQSGLGMGLGASPPPGSLGPGGGGLGAGSPVPSREALSASLKGPSASAQPTSPLPGSPSPLRPQLILARAGGSHHHRLPAPGLRLPCVALHGACPTLGPVRPLLPEGCEGPDSRCSEPRGRHPRGCLGEAHPHLSWPVEARLGRSAKACVSFSCPQSTPWELRNCSGHVPRRPGWTQLGPLPPARLPRCPRGRPTGERRGGAYLPGGGDELSPGYREGAA